MELHHLLTQVGSETRLSLLDILRGRTMGVLDLSNELYLSSIEVTHGLELLIEAGMVEMTEGGEYRDSGLGILVWENLAPMRYAASNQEYLGTHDLSPIPKHLFRTIERLTSSKIISARSGEFEAVRGYWNNVDGEFSLIAESLTSDLVSMIERMLSVNIKVRCILPKEAQIGSLGTHLSLRDRNLEIKSMAQGRLLLHVSKNFALMALKKRHGGADAEHIVVGTDPESISWCRDLFSHHWAGARIFDVHKLPPTTR